MKNHFLFKLVLLSFFNFFLSGHIWSQAKIIKTGDEWFYYDNGKPIEKDWYSNKSIGANWKKGISPLGYGDPIIATSISYGGNPENKHITKYFKKTFIVKDPYEHLIYKLNVQRDDGIVVYLNGQEVMRNNMPYGVITDATTANGLVFNNSNETITHTKLLSPDDLIAGLNIITATVHQARKESSDCLFNLELIGSDDSSMIPLLLKEQTIKNLNLDLSLKDMNHSQEIEKKNLQIEFIDQTKNLIKLFLIGTLILILILILFLYYKWMLFLTTEKKLTENVVELQNKNDNKDKEMMSLSLNLLNKQQYLKELKKDLELCAKEEGTILKKELKKIISRMDYNLDHDENDWENLKKHFNTVHTGYVDKLMKTHPSLTDIEIRHCIFIKLHMQTKEIAHILHIDPRSVQASRYRLKKKMNLEDSVDLKEYLINLS